MKRRYGTIKGRVVLKGDIPTLKPLFLKGQAPKDVEVCSATDVPDERLIVDPKTKGVKNVFAYIYKMRENQVHPDMKEPRESDVELVFERCRIQPRVLCIRVGQRLVLNNKDQVAHNPHDGFLRNHAWGCLLAPNVKSCETRFLSRESLPAPVTCDFHPWMWSNVLVLDHPYMAISKAEGSFEIPKVPYVVHSLRIWHETKGYVFRENINIDKPIFDLETVELTLDDEAREKLGFGDRE